MSPLTDRILKPACLARHYRGIIVSLVMLNTALIVFLIVYIWTYQPEGGQPGKAAPIAAGEVRAERVIMWSEPGGLADGAESRGVLEQGSKVEILRGRKFEGELWLEVAAGEREGWIPERDVAYDDAGGWPSGSAP